MSLPKITLPEVRKAAIAIVGGVAEAVNAGLVHGEAATIAAAVVAFLTAVGVYVVPNKAAKSPTALSAPAVTPPTSA